MNRTIKILALTAVIALGVSYAVGSFGPLRQTSINESAVVESEPVATISNVSVRSASSATGATVLSNSRTVTWQSSNFPSGARVDINLLKMNPGSPASYSLLRSIAKDTLNDGIEVWALRSGETLGNIYVEVVCSSASQFKAGCTSLEPAKVN